MAIEDSLSAANRSLNSLATADNSADKLNVSSGESPVIPGYENVIEIAQGEKSVVYRANDRALGREVAIKRWRSVESGSETSSRFFDSAQIAAQLQHPGIPPFFASETLPDGQVFQVMKLIKGETLSDLLSARPDPFKDRIRFLSVFEQLCQAIAYTHAHGVLHRDLKPNHVMIDEFGDVQVIGWGSANVFTNEEHGSSGQPASGLPRGGTPAYMPPEQARGEWDKLDYRADVFALGGILTEILTGKPTFPNYSTSEAIKKSSNGELSEAFSRLDYCGEDAGLIAIAKRCLNANPALRPANAGEVATLISGYRIGIEERLRKSEAERLAETALIEEKAKRKQWQLALLLVLGLSVIWNGAFVWWHNKQAEVARLLATKQEKKAGEAQQDAERERLAAERRTREAQERLNIQRKRRQLELEQAAKQAQRFREELVAPPPREVK